MRMGAFLTLLPAMNAAIDPLPKVTASLLPAAMEKSFIFLEKKGRI